MFRRFALAITAIAVALALAGPAAAAGTWTAKIGSATTGAGTFSSASTGSVSIKNTTTGVVYTCASSTVSGSIPHLGSGLSGIGVFLFSSTTWNSCTGSGMTVSLSQSGTWSANFVSYASPISTGNVTGIGLHVSSSGCSFNLAGSADVTYNNTTQVLAWGPVTGSGHQLTVSGVTGCFGVWSNGQLATLTESLKATAKSSTGVVGPLILTSP